MNCRTIIPVVVFFVFTQICGCTVCDAYISKKCEDNVASVLSIHSDGFIVGLDKIDAFFNGLEPSHRWQSDDGYAAVYYDCDITQINKSLIALSQCENNCFTSVYIGENRQKGTVNDPLRNKHFPYNVKIFVELLKDSKKLNVEYHFFIDSLDVRELEIPLSIRTTPGGNLGLLMKHHGYRQTVEHSEGPTTWEKYKGSFD